MEFVAQIGGNLFVKMQRQQAKQQKWIPIK
jgi:hypothetical protein